MATTGEHISLIRTRVKKENQDTKYSDPIIFRLMNSVRAFLLSRRFKNFSRVHSNNYQVACLPMEESVFYDCSCVSGNDCLVLKSTCEIPQTIVGRNTDNLKFYTLTGKSIQKVPIRKMKAKALSGLDKPYVVVFDKRAYLFNSEYRNILIEGVFVNPEELDGFCDCNSNPTTPCPSIGTDEYPIDGDLEIIMYDEVVSRLIQSASLPQDDLINDRNSNE